MNTCKPPSGDELSGVLLTGASSDIGRNLANYLLRHDKIRFVLTSNTSAIDPELAKSPNVLQQEGIDLTDATSLTVLYNLAKQEFKGPFALIHSVGDFWYHKPISDCDLPNAKQMIATHYLSLYGVLNKLLPVMEEVGGGRVLAFSCTSVGFSYPEMAAFTSAKAAVEALIRCTANEWSVHGITANAIALSTVATPKVIGSKPLADDENYITYEDINVLVEDLLFGSSPYFSGNVVRPLKHSHTYYGRAYYDRNPPKRNQSRFGV